MADATDCDDTDAEISPTGTETCASPADDDCDGAVDEDDAIDAPPWHPDADIDGRGDTYTSVYACERPAGYTADDTDCDDTDNLVHPGALEDCDTPGDDDCDGDVTGLNAPGCVNFYVDSDGDGYGTGTAVCQCAATASHSASETDDCDPADPNVYPAAIEAWENGVDDNCDGVTDARDITTEAVLLVGDDLSEQAGYAAAPVGDVDGDGWLDVAVSAPYKSHSGRSSGVVYVARGPFHTGQALADAPLILLGAAAEDRLGLALTAGDLTGDGTPDLVVSAPESDIVTTASGAVFIEDPAGSGDTTAGGAELILGVTTSTSFGWALAVATGAEGTALFVGAPTADDPANDAGAVYGFTTGAEYTTDAYVEIRGHGEGDFFGAAMATAGDTDGDGLDDLVVGATSWAEGSPRTGAACVIGGDTMGVTVIDEADCLYGDYDGDRAGYSVAGPGDVDGDGYADLLIGAPGWAAWRGRAWLVRSPPSARDLASADATFSLSPGVNAYVGYAVGRVGDQDADGLPDAAITAYYDDTFEIDAGTVYIASGTSTGSSDLADAYGRHFGQTYGHLGDTLTPLGDLDGDGVEDLLIGNAGYLTGSMRVGGAWVLPGG